MRKCFVAFGGNLGAVSRQFDAALHKLEALPQTRIISWSRLYRTTPIGSRSGDPYFNSAAAIETSLAPVGLLNELQRIEEDAGRRRSVHWGPRILDLDLIAADELVINSAFLTLPHPHCWYRRFVLDPWEEIGSDYVHPVLNESVTEMRERILARPLPVRICGFDSGGIVRNRVSGIRSVKIVEADGEPSAVNFTTAEGPRTGRDIDLSISDDPRELAEQVLRAALDTPVPLTKPGESWTVIE